MTSVKFQRLGASQYDLSVRATNRDRTTCLPRRELRRALVNQRVVLY